ECLLGNERIDTNGKTTHCHHAGSNEFGYECLRHSFPVRRHFPRTDECYTRLLQNREIALGVKEWWWVSNLTQLGWIRIVCKKDKGDFLPCELLLVGFCIE